VGIGTIPLAERLEVSGNVKADKYLLSDGSEVQSSLWSQTGSDIYYTEGNVVIGTATPNNKLVVSDGFLELHGNKGEDGIAQAILFTNGSADYNLAKIEAYRKGFDNQGALAFSINQGSNGWIEMLRISERGEVGIGASETGEKLTVAGNIKAAGSLKLQGDQTNGDGVSQAISFTNGSSGYDLAKIEAYRKGFDNQGALAFSINQGSNGWVEGLRINERGDSVFKGLVTAKEVQVTANPADFVFEEDYNLRSLNEVEKYIRENKHLPEIPSAAQMESQGVSVGDMQGKLLQKIEELTLYVIDLKKENQSLKEKIMEVETRL
jgi:hypothetical protein